MGLQVRGGLDDVLRSDHPADPPAGHGVRLGHPVDHDAGVRDLRHLHGHRGEQRVAVDEVLVDLVGDDPDPLLRGPLADRSDLIGGVDGPGRVGGGDEDEQLGVGGQCFVEVGHRYAVPRVLCGGDDHRHAAGQPDRLRVGGPVGRGQQCLVAGVEQRGEGVVERLLAAVGHEHLVRVDVVVGVPLGLRGDGVTQCRKAAGGRVPVHGGVLAGGPGSLDDVVRGREVGFARAESDDRAPRGFESLGLGVHGEGGRF